MSFARRRGSVEVISGVHGATKKGLFVYPLHRHATRLLRLHGQLSLAFADEFDIVCTKAMLAEMRLRDAPATEREQRSKYCSPNRQQEAPDTLLDEAARRLFTRSLNVGKDDFELGREHESDPAFAFYRRPRIVGHWAVPSQANLRGWV